ncbi:MAG: MlaD family protein [Flavobacteriales bacterium]|jgi:phospholipid/cholesterol/gamma-HCH transport system substrate-binding protein|nr:MlaD family protein [Flavobacteriales bacterium]
MKRREYTIALLVLAGAALLIFGINFLKGLDLLQKRNVYHVVYGNVAGIGESSPVYYNGYKVGQVVRTHFMPRTGHIAVSFQLNERDLHLPRDSRVEIYSADLFSRALQLLPGTTPAMAAPGDTLMGGAQLSLTDAVGEQIDPLKRKAEGMLASVDSVLTALQLILNDSARRDIDASFSSIRSTLETFNQSAQRLDAMIAAERVTVHNALANIEDVTGNLRSYNDEIGRIISNLDSVSTTLADGGLDRVMADLTSASGQLKTMMDRMEQGQGTLGALLHNDTLYQNLQSASREMDMLIEDLRLNPNRYVHLSLFGKKDKLPKLSDSDVDRIKRALQEDKRMQR